MEKFFTEEEVRLLLLMIVTYTLIGDVTADEIGLMLSIQEKVGSLYE